MASILHTGQVSVLLFNYNACKSHSRLDSGPGSAVTKSPEGPLWLWDWFCHPCNDLRASSLDFFPELQKSCETPSENDTNLNLESYFLELLAVKITVTAIYLI